MHQVLIFFYTNAETQLLFSLSIWRLGASISFVSQKLRVPNPTSLIHFRLPDLAFSAAIGTMATHCRFSLHSSMRVFVCSCCLGKGVKPSYRAAWRRRAVPLLRSGQVGTVDGGGRVSPTCAAPANIPHAKAMPVAAVLHCAARPALSPAHR